MATVTEANVCIVESIDFLQEDSLKEGEVISRTLRMSDKRSQYVYVRSRRELERLVCEFGRSSFRYLHISCHGNEEGFATTLDFIPSEEMAGLLEPHMNRRRLFISACLATNSGFARKLLATSGCLSILGPEDLMSFDDAAIFWSSFYHIMFKTNPDSMNNHQIELAVERCAALVDEKFRFFRRQNGKFVGSTIPSP